MSKIGIAGLQLEAAHGDNLDSMEMEIDAACARFSWLDVVVLGELNAHGGDPAKAQPMPGPFEERFGAIAKRNGIWLLPGSIMESKDGKLYNTVPVIDPDGNVVARYRKMFPWCPYENDATPGAEFVVFDIPGVGRLGVSNCYDMWFPETSRALACMGAEVIVHPSLTSTIDRDVEHCMARAAAAQNQCYFFDVNLAGPLGVGMSIVAGPGGEIVHASGKGREIVPLMLDLDYVRTVRELGWHGLGQPLKSFRDSSMRYPQYESGYQSEALDALGPLAKPRSPRLKGDK